MMGASKILSRGVWQRRDPHLCLLSSCPPSLSASLPHAPSLSPSLKLSPSQGQTNFLPSPSLTCPSSLAARAQGKDQWKEGGREQRGFLGGLGKNEVSCVEEQMGEAVGDWAWADIGTKNLKRNMKQVSRGP